MTYGGATNNRTKGDKGPRAMYKYSLPGRLAVWWIVNGKWLRGMQAVGYTSQRFNIHEGYDGVIHDGYLHKERLDQLLM